MPKLSPLACLAVLVVVTMFGCDGGSQPQAATPQVVPPTDAPPPVPPTPPVVSKRTQIFLCAGQSNMVGGIKASELVGEYATAPANAMYWSWATNGWIDFPDQNSTHGRIGPEISFAHRMAAALPNNRIALVKFSVGGTRLSEQWQPDTGDAYARLIAAAKAAIASLESEGESYELDAPELPVVVARSSDDLVNATQWDFAFTKTVQQAQENVARNNAHVYIFTIDDIAGNDDHTHFPPAGYFEIGNRFAKAMLAAKGW